MMNFHHQRQNNEGRITEKTNVLYVIFYTPGFIYQRDNTTKWWFISDKSYIMWKLDFWDLYSCSIARLYRLQSLNKFISSSLSSITFWLPKICADVAHTSKSPLPSLFKTQWYSNKDGSTHVWLINEQFKRAARAFHSSRFLGHLSTSFVVRSDAGHGTVIVSLMNSKYWKEW